MFFKPFQNPLYRRLTIVSSCWLQGCKGKFLSNFEFISSPTASNFFQRRPFSAIMKLITDKGNPFALKVLSACNVSGVKMEMEIVDKNAYKKPSVCKKQQLPILEIEAGRYLFDANAICCYIMRKDDNPSSKNHSRILQQDEMIEWDTVHLQPVMLPYLIAQASGKDESPLPSGICNALKTLEGHLNNKQFLDGISLSVADVTVWGSLFGLLHCSDKISGFKATYPSLVTWFENLTSQKAFSDAISAITSGKGVEAFKDALHGYSMAQICSKYSKESTGMENKKQAQETSGPETTEGPTPAEIADAETTWLAGRKGIQKPRSYAPPVLPRDNEKNILVTSALPYVNNVPHLGNIIGCVLSGDVYARFCRLRNYNVLYICGTDEYGTATETKAIEEGITPQQICDKYHKIHADIYKWFNIEFDYFGRTTTEQQTKISQDIFWNIEKHKYLKEDTLEQLQCIPCNRFLADRFVEGTCPFCSYQDARGDQCDSCGKLINAIELKKPRCKMCGSEPKVRSSKHIFLDLPKIEGQLKKWVHETIENGNWTANARHITNGWLQEGLKPRCITRDLKWGTPVPMKGFEDKVFYVWFDAPIGYLSITANYTEHWEQWWKNPDKVRLVQFMAKDNVPFHTVVFPCSLLAADDNYTLLNDISATEYLNYEDDKFSKSRGVGVFGDNAKDTGIPADIFRFYLLYLRPESQDSSFSWEDFVMKNNSELLNNLGNFVNRALMFLKNSFDCKIQEISLQEDDRVLLASINRELKYYTDSLEKIKLRDGIKSILNISKIGNQYMQANKPWVLVKGTKEERARAGTVISVACNLSALLAILVKPYMPEVSEEIQNQLKLPSERVVMVDSFIPMLSAGHQIGTPSPLFQKIDSTFAAKMKAKFAGKGKKVDPAKNAPKKDVKAQENANKENLTPTDLAILEEQIAKQGSVVRKAKMEQASKDIISKEVEILLNLKKKLALAQGLDPETATNSGKSKKKNKKN